MSLVIENRRKFKTTLLGLPPSCGSFPLPPNDVVEVVETKQGVSRAEIECG